MVAVGDGEGVGVDVGSAVGVGVGVIVGVGRGALAGVAVVVGTGVDVGVGASVGVGIGVAVSVGAGEGEEKGVGTSGGVAVVSSEHPARRMAKSAVAMTTTLITGLYMRVLCGSVRLQGLFDGLYTLTRLAILSSIIGTGPFVNRPPKTVSGAAPL